MHSDNLAWQRLIKDHLQSAEHPLIVILGPTASGKTGFSVKAAQWIRDEFSMDAEIINADSRQLFRGMDIGTAKVTREEMDDIPHHLLDMLNPNEPVSVAWFKQHAEEVIDRLHAEKKVPLLVGGSMLYIAGITDGLSFDKDIRTELRSPEATCKYDLLILGLGKERSEVVVQINNRTTMLFAAGWIDEVRNLLNAGYTQTDPGMKACGYREICDYLREESDLEELRESIAAKTRQYARRQMTWWRGDTRIHWL